MKTGFNKNLNPKLLNPNGSFFRQGEEMTETVRSQAGSRFVGGFLGGRLEDRISQTQGLRSGVSGLGLCV